MKIMANQGGKSGSWWILGSIGIHEDPLGSTRIHKDPRIQDPLFPPCIYLFDEIFKIIEITHIEGIICCEYHP
jgi:hypothetical protein